MKTLLARLEQIALGLSILAIVAMMLLTTYDAVARYALGKPLSWAFQLTTYYLLASATYFALSATLARGDHISIDALRLVLPTSFLRYSDAFWSVAAAAVMGVIVYGATDGLLHAYRRSEFLPGDIMWPVWLAILPIALGSGVMVLRLVINAWGLLFENAPIEIHHEEDVL